MERCSSDISVDVYDYEQKTVREEMREVRMEELALKEKDLSAYYEAVKERKAKAKELREKNGHAGY